MTRKLSPHHGLRCFSGIYRIEVYIKPKSPLYNHDGIERGLMKAAADALSVLSREMKWHVRASQGIKELHIQIAPLEKQSLDLSRKDMRQMLTVVCNAIHDYFEATLKETKLDADPIYIYNHRGRFYLCGILDASKFGRTLGFEYDEQKRLYFTQSPFLAKHVSEAGNVPIRRGTIPQRYLPQ